MAAKDNESSAGPNHPRNLFFMASSLPKPALIGDDVGCDTPGKQPIVKPYSLSYAIVE
ncbi:MAG TPA: hypothetical protein VHI75_00305 [Casimicrobiaceae bacterium]|nr:hypothetical protein [Casimicrobiaceae bacterium]